MAYTGTGAISGLGSQFYVNTNTTGTGAPVWTLLGEAKDLSLSGRKNTLQDATNLESIQKEFVATIPDPGKYAIAGNYLPLDPAQVFCETQFLNARPFQVKVQFPVAAGQTTTGDYKVFTVIMEEWNWPDKIGPNSLLGYSGTLQISGAVVTTHGS